MCFGPHRHLAMLLQPSGTVNGSVSRERARTEPLVTMNRMNLMNEQAKAVRARLGPLRVRVKLDRYLLAEARNVNANQDSLHMQTKSPFIAARHLMQNRAEAVLGGVVLLRGSTICCPLSGLIEIN